MKKKIAVYANGFNLESLRQALYGIREYTKTEDFDIFIFMCCASYGEDHAHNQGELSIYHLGRMEDFDGIIVFSNQLNAPRTATNLCLEAKEKNIPVVSIGMPIEGIPFISFTNEEGMRDLVTHLVEDHGVKHIIFLAGPADHIDSNTRLEVTRSVLEEHGLELKKEDIVYGDWGNVPARKLVHRLVESNSFPDAIVCANDIMAMAVMSEFIGMGYSVPQDMVITGFDNHPYGQNYFPALTTVDTNFKEIGYRSIRYICDRAKGMDVTLNDYVPSHFCRAESCGCLRQEEFVHRRELYCQHAYQYHLESTALEIYERMLRQRISEITEYEALKQELRLYYQETNFFEGKEFYIILNPEFFKQATVKEEDLLTNGYDAPMEVVVAFKNGQILSDEKAFTHQWIPAYEEIDGKQQTYILMPLHFRQYVYGYMVFTGDAPIIRQDLVNPYLEKLQQSLRLLRINMRLDNLNKDLTRLYNRDPMTGLYNRLAYEDIAESLYRQSIENKTCMMVMFVDINYMKRINDQFGHLHGDNAIKTVADSIRSVLKNDWIAVRFGGDEFLLIATNCTEGDAIQVRHDILSYLKKKNNDGTQPYEISCSCGYVITNPDKPSALKDYVKEADNLMYQIKQAVHARDGMPRR